MSSAGPLRAVLFDVDGTLVDSNYLHVEAWHHAFERLDVPADAWRIHRAIGQDSARLITAVAGERDEAWVERAKRLHSDYYRDLAPRLRPFDGSREVLAALAGRGIRVVLATSAPRDELELLLEALDAGGAIHATTSADDVETAKPDPAIIGVALERAGAEPSDAVFVGDSTWDMIAAGHAGVRAAYGLRSGGISSMELADAGARAVFDDPGDLLTNLDEIVGA